MSNFENILQFLLFSIALDMSRITHFLAEIMNPKNSASGNFLTFFMSAEQNKRLGLTASLLAGRVAGFPQILPGPGQPSENRALTAPYFQRYLPKTGWRAIPVLVCSRHHAYRVPPLVVRK